MKLFSYIKFFIFHATNWNIPLAVFALRHTLRGEKKYGLDTFVAKDLDELTIENGDKKNASRYEAVNYAMLEDMLENFRRLFPDEKKLLDAGCGKGRAMVVAAHYGFTDLVGVDFAEELCTEADHNLQKVKTKFPGLKYAIRCMDITEYPVTGESVFFLFNPFNEKVFTHFVENIENSLKAFPRRVCFIYVSPVHKEVLQKNGYSVLYHVKKMRYLEGIIAVKHPA